MQRFEICDFVCEKVCIEWERASSEELRYVFYWSNQKFEHASVGMIRQATTQPGISFHGILFNCRVSGIYLGVPGIRQIQTCRLMNAH
jgi:hypothetical protein